MNKTFRIGQSNELVQAGKVYDLHNHYDLTTVSVAADRSLVLVFEPNIEHGAGCHPLALEFSDVDFLEVSDEIGAKGIRDIDELGYKEPSDHDDEWLLSEGQASSGDHLIIRLVGGYVIRVHSKSAILAERNAVRP